MDKSITGLSPTLQSSMRTIAERRLERQFRTAQAEQDALPAALREGNSVDGLGRCEMRVHGAAYHEEARRRGTYECWADAGFRRDYLKRAPECRVKSTGTKLQVGWSPGFEDGYVAIFRKR